MATCAQSLDLVVLYQWKIDVRKYWNTKIITQEYMCGIHMQAMPLHSNQLASCVSYKLLIHW